MIDSGRIRSCSVLTLSRDGVTARQDYRVLAC